MINGVPFLALIILFSSISCTKTTDVNIRIKAKTNQGRIVTGAQVLINDKNVGHTDGNGRFKYRNKFNQDSTIRLEIRKESPKYYYAPYFESYNTGDHKNLKIDTKATLYFVPKPNQSDKTKVASAPTPQDKQSKEIPEIVQTKDKLKPEPEPEPEPQKSESKAENTESKESNPLPESPTSSVSDLHIDSKSIPIEVTGKGISVKKHPIVFSIYAYDRKRPLSNTTIKYGYINEGMLNHACKTNARGRCVVRFDEKPKSNITFKASRSGFQTQTKTTRVTPKGKLAFNMQSGFSLDIFTSVKHYNYQKSLEKVQVFIDGRSHGFTDSFGHFTYFHKGKKGDLIEVSLSSKNHIPRKYSTDFIVSGDMKMTKFFTPKIPPRANIARIKPIPSGDLGVKNLEKMLVQLDRSLDDSVNETFFKVPSFKKVARSVLEKEAWKSNRTISDIHKKGWHGSPLEHRIDALLKPVIVIGRKIHLELSIIDSKGKVIAAAKRPLSSIRDREAIMDATSEITETLTNVYPFEGGIKTKNGNMIEINIGSKSNRSIQIGKTIDVYGNQNGEFGKNKIYKKIANAKITSMSPDSSQAKITSLIPRATIAQGDLVIMVPKHQEVPKNNYVTLKIFSNGIDTNRVNQANIYLNNEWVGSSDSNGQKRISRELFINANTMKIVKHGFKNFEKRVNQASKKSKNIKINLKRQHSFIVIESSPPGATLKIEGKVLGKTPISKPLAVPSGFVKVELEAPNGFKDFTSIFELDEGTLDLSGIRKIKLERDLIKEIRQLVDKGLLRIALEKIDTIPQDHSDKLLGHFMAGEIYLTMLDEPHKAAKAFSDVTQHPKVKSYQDKRFIGAHINEGISLFKTAEKILEQDDKIAIAHYKKALETLQNVEPHLRFILDEQYLSAVHKVGYYQSLSLHRIWNITHDKGMISEVSNQWKKYLDNFAGDDATNENYKEFQNNANTYLRQALKSSPPNKG